MRKLDDLPYEVRAFSYGENPAKWSRSFKDALEAGGWTRGQIGVEPRALRFLEMELLQEAAPQASFAAASDVIAALRMRKDESEIAAMQQAVDIAQAAIRATIPRIKPGVTEQEIASELVIQMIRHGSEPKLPFFPIVSAGPNSANPHAAPGDRPMALGDMLVIDWGANVNGYCSDITRTFALGEVDQDLIQIAEIVKAANAAGHQIAGPGVPVSKVDQAARAVIEEAGYGSFFTHRTGHGLGLEGHEEPYLHGESETILEEGMTFTIEPGIYLPGRGGVRIEDDVVVTAEGVNSLTTLPRSLHILEV
jgi:Xaa-Pro dipeptidase